MDAGIALQSATWVAGGWLTVQVVDWLDRTYGENAPALLVVMLMTVGLIEHFVK